MTKENFLKQNFNYRDVASAVLPIITKAITTNGFQMGIMKVTIFETERREMEILVISTTCQLIRLTYRLDNPTNWEDNVIQNSARLKEIKELSELRESWIQDLGMTEEQANDCAIDFFRKAKKFDQR